MFEHVTVINGRIFRVSHLWLTGAPSCFLLLFWLQNSENCFYFLYNRLSQLSLCIVFPLTRINHFSKKFWFLLGKMAFRDHIAASRGYCSASSATASGPSQLPSPLRLALSSAYLAAISDKPASHLSPLPLSLGREGHWYTIIINNIRKYLYGLKVDSSLKS